MNKTHRKVWSAKHGAYVVASEIAKSNGKATTACQKIYFCEISTRLKYVFGIALIGFVNVAHANIHVSLEAPGVFNSTALFLSGSPTIVTFNGMTPGSFSPITVNNLVTVTGGSISRGDDFGGAPLVDGNSFSKSDYITTGSTGGPITIQLSTSQTYFGIWISAINDGNIIELSGSQNDGATSVLGSFDSVSLNNLMSGGAYTGGQFRVQSALPIDYFASQNFGFVNFYATGNYKFTSIKLSGVGFESDNFTVGMYDAGRAFVGTAVSQGAVSQGPRPINLPSGADVIDDLVSGAVIRVFDGGVLNLGSAPSASVSGSDFTVTDEGGSLLVSSGVVSFAAKITNDSSSTDNTKTSMKKVGNGTVILTANNTFTGSTFIDEGALILSGSLTSNIVVASGAKLQGTGSTSGGLTSFGTVAPGNSPGTLSVAGNVTLSSTSIFEAEIDGRTYDAAGGAGTYDRLDVTGTTSTFTAGGNITPILRGITEPANNNFDPVIGDAFRVVTTANATGVNGTGFFATVTDPTAAQGMPANSRFDVIYGANYVDLVLTPGSFGAFAQGYGIQNMVNAATAFDGIRPAQGARGNTDRFAFFNGLYGLGAAPLATTLLQASGEIHAFALSETRQGWQSSNGLVVTAASINAHRNVWVDTSAQDIKYDQDAYASAYKSNNTHLWVGTHVAEYKGAQFGVAAGVDRRKMSSANTGSAETDTNALALYAIGRKDQFDYSAIFSLNQSKIDTKRQTGLSTGALSNSSDSKAKGAVLSVSAGFNHALNDKVNGRVWVNGLVDQTKANALTEQGSTVTALSAAKESFKSAQATVGYTLSGNVSVPDSRPGKWSLGAGVSKLMSEGRPHVSRQMSLHGASWQVTTPKVGTTTEFVQAGVILPVGTNADAWINLGASKRDGASASSGSVGLSVKW
jgi:autotransporter-associated beta strand protein